MDLCHTLAAKGDGFGTETLRNAEGSCGRWGNSQDEAGDGLDPSSPRAVRLALRACMRAGFSC